MDKDTVAIHFVEAAVARLTPAGSARVLEQAGISPELQNDASREEDVCPEKDRK